MALNETGLSGISAQYQKHFKKDLLKHAIQELRLNEFAMKATLPKNLGAKVVSFMRRVAAAASNVQVLTEGTPISTFTSVTMTEVPVTLAQLGEATKFTDLLSWTQLYNTLKQGVALMGEDCALKADDVTRAVVCHETTGATKRYGSALADFTALSAATAAAGKAVATDFLDAVTKLKINRSPKIGGAYAGIIAPQISRDMMNDPDWLEAHRYQDAVKIFNGELGRLHGIRFVEATNPWIEDEAEGTYDAADGNTDGLIYSTIITGQDAYGVTALDGQSPFGPQIIICDKADKSDPLNQTMTAGWKSYYGAVMLNAAFAINLRSKTTFVG